MLKKRIAIFASGTGSNAINLIKHFKESETIEIGFVLSNRTSAPIVESANNLGVTVHCITNEQAADDAFLTSFCKERDIDWIVLAGYLRLIPAEFINSFSERIINLHPSLLPKYGGKGMYGANVHRAVLENREDETGITIHYVNQEFDKGRIIAQFRCALTPQDTLESVQKKIQFLEHSYLPIVIEQTIKSTL